MTTECGDTMEDTIEPQIDLEPDSPEWWNRQLTYIMNESFNALKQAANVSEWEQEKRADWIKRAEYLREMAIKCVNNAYKSIQLQIEEEKQ